jgi:hypothetical protein
LALLATLVLTKSNSNHHESKHRTNKAKRELEVFLAVFNACGSDLRDFANAHIPDGGANIKYFGHEESVNILSHDAWRELKRIYEGRLNNF